MEARAVAFTHEVTREQLRSLIVGMLGGRRDDEPDLDQGVVERGASIVHASIESVTDLESVEEGQLQKQLGRRPWHWSWFGLHEHRALMT